MFRDFVFYIIPINNGNVKIGITGDFNKRLKEHNRNWLNHGISVDYDNISILYTGSGEKGKKIAEHIESCFKIYHTPVYNNSVPGYTEVFCVDAVSNMNASLEKLCEIHNITHAFLSPQQWNIASELFLFNDVLFDDGCLFVDESKEQISLKLKDANLTHVDIERIMYRVISSRIKLKNRYVNLANDVWFDSENGDNGTINIKLNLKGLFEDNDVKVVLEKLSLSNLANFYIKENVGLCA